MNKQTIALLLLIVCLLSSCKGWIELDMKRYFWGFVITLSLGLIGFLIHLISNKNKN